MFSRVARMKRSSWVLLGIVLGVVVAPGAALAAFTDVRVTGIFGSPPAAVTSAYQLRVAEIDPVNIRHYRLSAAIDSCSSASVAVPAGNSFLIKQIEIDAFSVPAPSSFASVYVYDGPGCIGNVIAEVTPLSNRQTDQIPLVPGAPIRSGGGFSARTGAGNMSAAVHITGYLMPANAVPAGAPALSQTKGTAKGAPIR